MRMGKEKRDRRRGYTILEVLIVLGIISLIGAVVGLRLTGYLGKAKSDTARLEMDNLRTAVELFYVDVGRYPTEEEGLAALLARPGDASRWDGPYITDEAGISDPWERPYGYALTAGTGTFKISTLGRDGVAGGEGEDADLTR